MAPHPTVDVIDGPPASSPPQYPVEGPAPRPRKRRWVKVLIGVGIAIVVLIVAALVWFFVGRDEAHQVSDDAALENLRSGNGGTASEVAGLPAIGVYSATATGSEAVGVPGLDEDLGPNAPVTVTHDDAGCFSYRVDFNSHYWRVWTWCPTADATTALTRLESHTGRTLPGITVESLATYTCETPVPFLWSGGDTRRTGACTGSVSGDDGITNEVASVELLDRTTVTVGGEDVDVVHLRSTEQLSGDQTGDETDEWWIDAETGLPVRMVISIHTKGEREYTVTGTLDLTTLTPAT